MAFVVCLAHAGNFTTTDFGAWGSDWTAFMACFQVEGCAALSKFPLAHMLNSAIVSALSPVSTASDALWLINSAFVLFPLFILVSRDRSILLAGVYLLAILISPIPRFYVNSGALELQYGVVIGLFFYSLFSLLCTERLGNRHADWTLLATTSFLLPLYKDTSFFVIGASTIFAILVGTLCRDSVFRFRRLALVFSCVALPMAAALLAQLSYNQLRYGVPFPIAYLAEAEATAPPLSISVGFLIGSVFSPHGGILAFWLCAIFVATIGVFLLGYRPNRLALLAALTHVVISLLGFSLWWAPFGWDSWGNRLMVPAMMGLLVTIILTSRPVSGRSDVTMVADLAAKDRMRRILGRRSLIICGALAPFLGYSAYFVAVSYASDIHDMARNLHQAGPACKEIVVQLQNGAGSELWNSQLYYDCAYERMTLIPSF